MMSGPNFPSKLALAVLLGSGLAACGGTGTGPTSAQSGPEPAIMSEPEDAVVVTVNGEAISEAMLARTARNRGLDLSDPAQRKEGLDLLVETVLLAQEAIADGMAARPDVRTELDLLRVQALAARNLSETRAAMNLDDTQLREFYQQVVSHTGNQELHLRHALFAEEADARAALPALSAGADFDAWVAGLDRSAVRESGDLGWLNLAQLPPELARVAVTLPDAGVSAEPIQSRFGWHVIQRVGSREFAPPPFEQVREGIRKQAGDKHLEEKIAQLRARATIELPGDTADTASP
ncbi:MAG: peptidyl-prolyl cis-trans isomerase [Lysobacteraceae bacterium]